MSESFASLLPVLVVPAFITLWCGVSLLLSKLGGWSSLAARFPATSTPFGEKFTFAAAKIGGVRYRGVLTAVKAEQGLFLSVFAPWRLGHPPILIPWTELKNPQPKKLFGTDWLDVSVSTPRKVTLRFPESFVQGKLPRA